MATNSSHTWNFFRAGGSDQVQFLSGADFANLDQLDQKLWGALASPAKGLEFDTKTLELVDSDKDGRIRAPEIIAAAKWAAGCLKNPDDLLKGASTLSLSAINETTPGGKGIRDSARQILDDLGKKDATEIAIEDTADTVKIFAQTRFNGDGIIPVDAAEDDAIKSVLNDVIALLGSEPDRSGKPGVNQARVDEFFKECEAFSTWWEIAEKDAANVLPLGDSTTAAYAALAAIKAKVDDYFSRCRLAAFDPRALAALNRQESEYLELTAKDLSITAAEVSGFPLARIEAGRALPLVAGVNPAWEAAVAGFVDKTVKPVLGSKEVLTEAEWTSLNAKFAPYAAWNAVKAGGKVSKLGIKRVRELLGAGAKDAITALIARDKALEPQANAIANVEKLLRLHRDLGKLLNNYVNFRDFYSRTDKAIFQAGTLYIDSRSCDLCILVQDAGRHAKLAGLAGAYLAYCTCERKATGEKMEIVAAVTDGDTDNLMVGRNGVFYDRKGRDFDATITRIVDNPISIRQAFWAPYKRLVRAVESMVAKRASTADAAAGAKIDDAAASAAAVGTAKPAAAPAAPKKFDVGTVAAMGVAISGAITALTLILGYVFGLKAWQYPLLLIGIMLFISGPSMIIAWLKLRKRNLGPILDANGWAVNAPSLLSVGFGKTLTQVAVLPKNAKRGGLDPFEEQPSPWRWYLALVVFVGVGLAWYWGNLDPYVPGQIKSTTVFGTNAPAYVAPAPAAPAESSPAPAPAQ